MILMNGEMPSLASPTTSNHLLSSNPRLNQRWRGDAAAPPAKPVIGGKIFQNCVTSLTLAHAFKVLLNSWKIFNIDFSRWKNLLNYEEKLMSTVHSCVGVDEVSWDLMTIMVWCQWSNYPGLVYSYNHCNDNQRPDHVRKYFSNIGLSMFRLCWIKFHHIKVAKFLRSRFVL